MVRNTKLQGLFYITRILERGNGGLVFNPGPRLCENIVVRTNLHKNPLVANRLPFLRVRVVLSIVVLAAIGFSSMSLSLLNHCLHDLAPWDMRVKPGALLRLSMLYLK